MGYVTGYTYDALGRVTGIRFANGSAVSYTYDANGQVLTSTDELGGVTAYTYDANGQLLTMTDPMGGVVAYTYDGCGNVLSVTDPLGLVTRYTYNSRNLVETVTDPGSHTTTYTYNAVGNVETVTDPMGGVTRYAYDLNGDITAVTDAEGHTVSYHYDALRRLVGTTDARGSKTSFDYDNEGALTSTKDALGFAASRTYDKAGNLISEKDKNGNVWTYAYDADYRLISVKDPLGNVTRYTYDALGQMTSSTTPLGHTTEYTYDEVGELTSTTDPLDHTTTYLYDAKGQVIGIVNKDGTETSATYDANGRLVKTVDEKEYEVLFTYDADGRQTAVQNARGYTTTFEYDDCGNLTVITDALEGKTVSVYDANHNLLSITDAEGYVTSYTYDKMGRITSTTDANGALTKVSYDANGNIVKLVQADGHEITYSYNARNELVSYVDAEGYTHAYTYDGNGNITTVTDGNGNVTAYTYDGLNRPISAKNGEDGVSHVTYDADGRITKVVDEEGGVTSYEYDADDRLIAMTDAEGYSTTFEYDAMNRVVAITDARKGVTSYTYTRRGELATRTDAEGYVISYEYDGNGNCVKMTTVDGDTTYEYDPLDRLVKTVTPDGESESFTYDKVGNITSSTDKNGNTTRYVYDGMGNVVETIDALGTSALFEYDKMGNLTKTSLHRVDTQDNVDEWEITLYEFDGRGLTTKQVDALGSETTFAYDGMARVTEMHYPNGWVEYYTYDKMGRILSVDDTHPSEKPAKTQKHTYRYDANGNIVYEYMRGNGTGQAKNETLYTYDALNRLVSAHDNYGNSTRNYTYDSLGNLTFETGMGSHNCDYIYNNLNQQIDRSVDDWKTHTASTYDKRGNLVLEEYGKNKQLTVSSQYEFDETNRMVRGINGNGEESIYTYNGWGALMEQTWIIAKNGYGYHNVSANPDDLEPDVPDLPDPDPDLPDVPDPDPNPGINNEGNGNQDKGNDGNGHVNGNNGNHNGQSDDVTPEEPVAPAAEPELELENAVVQYGGQPDKGNNGENGGGNGNKDKPTGSDVKKTSTVIKEFVVDFSTDTFRPLMEHEVNGLDYRYVYSDKARLSVVVQGIEHGSSAVLDDRGELHAYYHCDYLGTTDYLTSAVDSRVIAWTSYSEWGEISHNAVLKCGQRELDLVKEYATHDYDAVLNMYYAKARFYDADNRHFTAVDPILDPSQYDLRAYTIRPAMLVQYPYVRNNAVNWVDISGGVASVDGNIIATRTVNGREYAYVQELIAAYGGSPVSFNNPLTKSPKNMIYKAVIQRDNADMRVELYTEFKGENVLKMDVGRLDMAGLKLHPKPYGIDWPHVYHEPDTSSYLVDIGYFQCAMCAMGAKSASIRIGSKNTGLTGAQIKQAAEQYGLNDVQKNALKKINQYYWDAPRLTEYTTIFAFEGAGSVGDSWGVYHPYGQFNAMMVSVSENSRIVALSTRGSTLPDRPKGYNSEGNYMAVAIAGIYDTFGVGHGGGQYAATNINREGPDGAMDAYRWGSKTTATGIDFHAAQKGSPSSWSEGCLYIDFRDYIKYGRGTGFINDRELDFEVTDYWSIRNNLGKDKYLKEFNGKLVIDRSIFREKIETDYRAGLITSSDYKGMLEYYFGERG